jgi:hypothetical protein
MLNTARNFELDLIFTSAEVENVLTSSWAGMDQAAAWFQSITPPPPSPSTAAISVPSINAPIKAWLIGRYNEYLGPGEPIRLYTMFQSAGVKLNGGRIEAGVGGPVICNFVLRQNVKN